MTADTSKADWKLFREKIGDWQEAYMERLLKQYVKLLQNTKKPAGDRFYELDKRIQKDRKSPGVRIRLEKEDMELDIARLIHDKVITWDDLEGFSDDLKQSVQRFLNLGH